jgi:hypothetical protein
MIEIRGIMVSLIHVHCGIVHILVPLGRVTRQNV